jgi:hypothetical protein
VIPVVIRRSGRHVAGSDHAPMIIGVGAIQSEAILLWDSNVQRSTEALLLTPDRFKLR